MKRVCLALISLLAASAGPAIAMEIDSGEPHQRAVSVEYSDLDLSRREDAATLLGRLQLAATRACEVREIRQPGPTLRRAIEHCREAAMTEAVASIDEPELTRLYVPDKR